MLKETVLATGSAFLALALGLAPQALLVWYLSRILS